MRLKASSKSKMAESDDEFGLVDVKMEDAGDVSDDFKFQDFTKVDDINNLNTVGNIEEEPGITAPGKIGTHSLEDISDDDEEDKTELLADQRKQPPFWTFEYYQTFFDVDSYQVIRRIIGSMVPAYKKNYLVSLIRPNPDLYGPFWVCATLVFTTAISGNLASYLINTGDHQWVYDFHKDWMTNGCDEDKYRYSLSARLVGEDEQFAWKLISSLFSPLVCLSFIAVTLAAAAIYSYAFIIPSLLWGLLLWRRSNAGYSFLEILCVYGYSLSIYIPISIMWVAPLEWLRWLLVMIGMILSGSVLLLTFWPAVEDDDKKVAGIILATIFVFHGLLAVGFKLYFFHAPPEQSTVLTPTAGNMTAILF